MGDETGTRKTLPCRTSFLLAEEGERSLSIESAATEVGFRPCKQVKSALLMGRSEIDTCCGKPIDIVGPLRWVNRMNDLLASRQALLHEGKESAILVVGIAEKGTYVRASTEQCTAQVSRRQPYEILVQTGRHRSIARSSGTDRLLTQLDPDTRVVSRSRS
jgi:hypothetical protein